MHYQLTTANNPVMTAYFQGRWAAKELQQTPVMTRTNLGAEFWLQVTGASYITLAFLNWTTISSWLAVQIDGLPYQRFPVASAPIRLTLDAAPHILRVVMSGNTDEDQVWTTAASFAVKGVQTDGELAAIKPGRHSITWIGDSLTAGCWVAGRQPAEDYRGEANYAAIASDLLDARNVRLAYSAIGLSKPGTGGVPPLPDVLTALDRSTPWEPVPTDVVVVNVGTNDGRLTADEFAAQLRQFLNQVQTLYPNSRLAVMIPFSQRFDRIIRSVVASFMQIDLIETATWEPTTTDHIHLDSTGSQVAGQLTAAALRQLYPRIFN